MTDPGPESAKPTVHEATYQRLRDLVLFGELAPGQKVTIQGLTAVLDAGMTPVREAIRRLTAEGALHLHANRRVSVPVLSQAQLDEIGHARLALEPELARRALPNLTRDAIVRLQRLDDDVDAAIATGDVPRYLKSNTRFHFALYEAAEAPILLSLTRTLWLRAGPSLRAVMTRGEAPGPDLHKKALAAIRAGDAVALGVAVAGDIRQGLARIADEARGG
jgi:DNA-binding GntR family transcriptional regulator